MVLTYRLQLRVGTGTAPASMFRPPRETSNREYSPLESDRARAHTSGSKLGSVLFMVQCQPLKTFVGNADT